MSPVRVLLVDDHVLVRAGIRLLLEGMADVTVVAEADDGCDALRLVKLHQPNLVVMDIAMKRSNGLQVTSQIKAEFPKVNVIVLSMHATEEYVLQALRMGASGYLVKDSATMELELALQSVMDGQTYLSPAVSRQVVDNYLNRSAGGGDPLPTLTPRQQEILVMIAQGHATKEIAFELRVSVKTVESHRLQLMSRLDIHDVPGLVRYAIRKGLVAVGDA